MTNIYVCNLGEIPYQEAWELQEKVFKKSVDLKTWNRLHPDEIKLIDHYLLICSHPPVFTLGKSGKPEHLLLSKELLESKGISYYPINRGGDITYHGPGSIVGYPILDLDHWFTDIHKYLRFLEEMVIQTLAEYGIESGRIEGLTGVWLDIGNKIKERKICAFGIRASRWITMHGWSLNVNTLLEHFNYIIPCGIQDKAVTSMEKELGNRVDENEVVLKLMKHFALLFEVEFVALNPLELHRMMA